jgi:chemotaxis protein MotB
MAKQRVIIKKKKVAAHGGSHGGAWKVAYADFVTAMMAFFLVMWILGLSESTRKDIAGYFRDPGIFGFSTTKGSPVKISIAPDGPRMGPTGAAENNPIMKQPENGAAPRNPPTKIEAFKASVERRLGDLAKKQPKLKKLLAAVEMHFTSEGLRIELSETKDVAYFSVGGAKPNRAAEAILLAMAPTLAELGNPVVVEGHTDTRAYRPGAKYTNWELSADRANAARRLLIGSGLPAAQITSVSGYADVQLRKPENPYDVSNRRVSIVVKYKDDQEMQTTKQHTTVAVR